ncbi:MAG: UPF0280 family protein [Candidatus Omnitrophica bacterium]|nr:UPF0280 family protein [Candidatus Omnitrophota bacterium]MBU4472858.1 UPF0280 family protein [Candidatus Omnitrophota bacterium]MCG2706092.1 UPF0280 family protein [Candidatus Omnitrophota bacterium]
MKTNKYQRRFYREWVKSKDLFLAHVVEKETDLQILTDRTINKDFVQGRIRSYRREIESYISKDRKFLTTLRPIQVGFNAPLIVKNMAQAAKRAGVGPMASVAGAIAQFLGRALVKKGYREIIIENGGDIYLKTRKPRKIAIYAGRSKLFKKLSLKIKPEDTPIGICTSSGSVGHSLSFGLADAVVILSKDASLADAVATASANQVRSRKDLEKSINFAKSIKGVLGAIIIIENNFISWGKIEFTN